MDMSHHFSRIRLMDSGIITDGYEWYLRCVYGEQLSTSLDVEKDKCTRNVYVPFVYFEK